MPPQLALLLCIIFTVYLFKYDFKRNPNVSHALWIPLIWITIIGSRFVSQWLGADARVSNITDGSPIDRAVFSVLIIGGVFVLSRRKIPWSQIIQQNLWLILFYAYSGFSVIWSDFPFVAFKRWIKEVGNLIMVMVILSEYDPIGAIKTVFRRSGYLLIPLSIVLIKYYPEYGRSYTWWTGEVSFRGVGLNKNYLGFLCLTFGFFFSWCFLESWRKRARVLGSRIEIFVYIMYSIFETRQSKYWKMSKFLILCTRVDSI